LSHVGQNARVATALPMEVPLLAAGETCSCSQLSSQRSPEFVYTCGTARARSLTAAAEQAERQARGAMAAQLGARSNGDDELDEYIRRVSSEADSCVSVAQETFIASVLLRLPRALAHARTNRTLATTPASVAAVANAWGQINVVTIPAVISLPVRATPPTYGNFVFRFSRAPESPRVLRLESIHVIEDGSGGPTRWTFSILVNEREVTRIPQARYADNRNPPDYPVTATVLVPSGTTRLKVLGYRP
jgi:hypothetical protein